MQSTVNMTMSNKFSFRICRLWKIQHLYETLKEHEVIIGICFIMACAGLAFISSCFVHVTEMRGSVLFFGYALLLMGVIFLRAFLQNEHERLKN